jgi:hypothetical protein
VTRGEVNAAGACKKGFSVVSGGIAPALAMPNNCLFKYFLSWIESAARSSKRWGVKRWDLTAGVKRAKTNNLVPLAFY